MEVAAVFWYNSRMDYKKQSHSVYYTRYHLVISTKYRRKVLKAGIGEYLKKMIIGIGERNPEIEKEIIVFLTFGAGGRNPSRSFSKVL